MPRRPPFRFLLRASLLLMAMLVLWGSVLLDPLRAGLRVCTAAALWLIPGDGRVAEAAILPNGDWSLRLPMPAAAARAAAARQEPVQQMLGRTSQDAAPINIVPGYDIVPGYAAVRSLKLVVEGKYPAIFTAGLPFYWALILASGWTWRRGRRLLEGSAALFAMAVVSMAFYAIRLAIKNSHLITGRTAVFLLDLGEYFVVNVIPYLAPLLLALYLDLDLRTLVFTRQAGDWRPAPPRITRTKAEAGL
ncbi:MAG TPA: hypothetical protein VKJ01_05335 [Candidatus Solibacter sp.]|nr:hypothetical protein [Candidatus Solibacter sp.]